MSVQTIGIAVNPSKEGAIPVTARLIDLIEQQGANVFVDEKTAAALQRPDLALPLERMPERADVLFVLGGDGTILGYSRQFAKDEMPLLGINLGHLGFLSEAEPKDLENAVKRVLEGDYCLESRLMLDAQVIRNGRVVLSDLIALNDIGIAKGVFGRMVTCKVFVDDLFVDQYTGDGLLVSTPTGSTAYSLSAGGPIIAPHIDVILLTTICPHTLHARPLVIAANQEVRVEVTATHEEIVLSVDGQLFHKLEPGDEIVVRQSAHKTALIKWRDREFYEVLRQKLHRAT